MGAVTEVDLGELSSAVVPHVSAAVAAYGGAVIQRVTDQAVDGGADVTVGWGRRLLARLFASGRGPQVSEAVRELVDDPEDEASMALVRAQVLKAVTADPELASDLREMVAQAQPAGDRYSVTVSSSSCFQIGSHNIQTNHNVTGQPET
jgi:hypothetical protein